MNSFASVKKFNFSVTEKVILWVVRRGPTLKSGSMATSDQMNPDELTEEEQQLLNDALANLTSFIEEQTTHYAFVEDDPRNDEDYDTYEYGTEPLPGDETWVKAEDTQTD